MRRAAAGRVWLNRIGRRLDSRVGLRPEQSDISAANEIAGSQTGSQRPQAQGRVGPHPAIISAAGRHVGPHRATPGPVAGMPPKQ